MAEIIIAGGIISILAYMFPSMIAIVRWRQPLAILMLNLFLGWTIIGWVVALVWACTSKKG